MLASCSCVLALGAGKAALIKSCTETAGRLRPLGQSSGQMDLRMLAPFGTPWVLAEARVASPSTSPGPPSLGEQKPWEVGEVSLGSQAPPQRGPEASVSAGELWRFIEQRRVGGAQLCSWGFKWGSAEVAVGSLVVEVAKWSPLRQRPGEGSWRKSPCAGLGATEHYIRQQCVLPPGPLLPALPQSEAQASELWPLQGGIPGSATGSVGWATRLPGRRTEAKLQ